MMKWGDESVALKISKVLMKVNLPTRGYLVGR